MNIAETPLTTHKTIFYQLIHTKLNTEIDVQYIWVFFVSKHISGSLWSYLSNTNMSLDCQVIFQKLIFG